MRLKRPDKKQLIRNYRFTFRQPEGKRVLEDLAKKVPLFKLSALQTNPALDTNTMMYQEGQRSVLLYIYKTMNLDPEAEIQEEAINEETLTRQE